MSEEPDPRDKIRPLCPLFAEAFLNIGHRAFGFRMRDFCLWHTFLLHHHKSPVIFRELSVGLDDVLLAARIGACRYGEWPKPLHRWSLPAIRARRIARREGAEREALRLRDWMADSGTGPDFWREEKTGFSATGEAHKERGSMPAQLDTVTRLMMLGIPERTAWEMPVGKARWYAAAYAAQAGAELDFVEPLPPAFEAHLRAEVARHKEAEAKKPPAHPDAGKAPAPPARPKRKRK